MNSDISICFFIWKKKINNWIISQQNEHRLKATHAGMYY